MPLQSQAPSGAPPLPNSYWVLPGRLLAGEYPGAADDIDTDQRIDLLLQAGVDVFVDLTMPGELPPYHPRLPLSVEYDRRPIVDHGIPEHFQQMDEIVELIADALRRRRAVYVHCRAGIGRTGTTIACYLAQTGLAAPAALQQLNDLWQQCARSMRYPTVPETSEQAQFVHEWVRMRGPAGADVPRPEVAPTVQPVAPEPPSLVPIAAVRQQQRFAGALLGLAAGEALGAATHNLIRGSFDAVTGMQGGGPAQLPRGAWADDTALALCLADSLLSRAAFDPRDQVARYQRWQTEGYLSATGAGAGIEPGTAKALGAARWRRQMYAGSHDPNLLQPEPLALAGIPALYFAAEPGQALDRAAEAARTICQAPQLLSAMRCVAQVLLRLLAGQDRGSLLAIDVRALALPRGAAGARLTAVVDGRFRAARPEDLKPDGDAIDLLECALWALWRGRDFRDATLAVVNLGGRSDVTGALVGQLAGARFGATGIPADWLATLARRELIAEYADRIFAVSRVGSTA
jgi:ADP-ribosylglycohydrolase